MLAVVDLGLLCPRRELLQRLIEIPQMLDDPLVGLMGRYPWVGHPQLQRWVICDTKIVIHLQVLAYRMMVAHDLV